MKLRSNIDKLKILTDALIDRDYVRSKVVNLFEKFCSDFPVEMCAWIVDKDLNITSKKGPGITSDVDKQSLDEVFSGKAREKNLKMHKKAFLGESNVYTIEVDDKILLTKVMPANSSNELVFGFSMDVTSFVKTSNALNVHCEDMENSDCDLIKEVRNDKLYKLVTGRQ